MGAMSALPSPSARALMRRIPFNGTPATAATWRAAWRDALLACLLYALITALMFWPVLAHLADTFPVDLGDPPNESWLVAWGVHALVTDPGQLLGGNIYYPHTNALVYNDNLLGLLPLSTPVFLLSGGNAALTYNALYLLSFVLCGLGTFLLARSLTGSTAGAVLAGIVVAFSPYRMVHLSHLNQLSGQWLPLVVLFWERARRAAEAPWSARLWPEFAAMGVFFVLQALCSIYYAVFLSTCLAIYLLLYLLAVGFARARRFILGVAATAVLTALALLPVLLPYLRLQGRVDAVRGPQQVLYFSADLRDFLHMPTFSVLYGWTARALAVPARDAHQYLFPGIAALALALLGRRWGRDRLEIRIYTILLVVTAILSLGRQLKAFDRVYAVPMPYALLYDHLPGYHSFRDPARFFSIGYLCLALLAAWGLGALLERGAWPIPRRRVVAALACLAVLAEFWILPVATPRVAVGDGMAPVYRWLKARPAHTAVLELPIGQMNATIWSQQALMTYHATYHWQSIVNGVGGYTPDGYERDAALLNRWPAADARRWLTAHRVCYVIWHPEWTHRAGPAGSPLTPVVARWPDGTRVYRVR